MAGSAGSIFIDLLLRSSSYESGLKRSQQQTRQWANNVQSDTARASKSFSNIASPAAALTRIIGGLGGAIAAAFSVQKIVEYTDTWKQLQGRLSLVVSDMGQINAVQAELSNVAERTRQPLEGVYNLYTRIAQAIPESQRANYDLLGVVESINIALAITGEGTAQAQSAILQFSQAVQSDFKASAQEINSLLDSAPRLAQALARSVGDGTQSLKQLAADGKLSTREVLNALAGVGEEGRRLREEFAKIPPTVGQAFTVLNNSILEFVGKSTLAREATDLFAVSVMGVAKFIKELANDSSIADTAIYGMTATLVDFYRAYNEQAAKVAEATNFFGLRDNDVKEYQDNVNKAIAARQRLEDELYSRKTPVDNTGLITPTGNAPATVPPASQAAVAAAQKRVDILKQTIEQLRIDNDQARIRLELFGQEKSAIDAAARSYDIYNKLREGGVKLGRGQREEIELLLKNLEEQERAYNRLDEEAKKAAEAERQRLEGLNQLGSTLASAFEDAIVNGGTLSDVMQGLLQDIARVILRLTIVEPMINGLKDSIGAGGSGGGLLGLLGGLFGGGAKVYNSPIGPMPSTGVPLPSYAVGAWNVPNNQVAQLHAGEMVVPAIQAEKFRTGGMGSGNVVINNYSGEKATATQSSNGDILVTIGDVVAGMINRDGTPVARAIDNRNRRSQVMR